ncbi:MAG TPA: hypothetical protein PKV96_01280 [Candidatus Saccharimonas sp.]|nr:hypothetical protein [Candidatus Saccharimonas sp.]
MNMVNANLFPRMTWKDVLGRFEEYRQSGADSTSASNFAERLARQLSDVADEDKFVSPFDFALAIIDTYRDPADYDRDRNLAAFANQDRASDEWGRSLYANALAFVLSEVFGDAVSEFIMGYVNAEHNVLMLRVYQLVKLRDEILATTPLDTYTRLRVGDTWVEVYRGSDGCGHFDAERISLRPFASRKDNIKELLLAEDGNGRLRIIACFAPLGTAITMLDDVLANWPSYTVVGE